MDDKVKQKFWEMVGEANHILITSHMSPDDDSISSTLGLYSCIQKIGSGKDVRIVYTGEIDPRYISFENFSKIEFVKDIALELRDTDLMIVLDTNQYSRISKLPENLKNFSKTICIDHHSSPPDEFSLSIIDTTIPSNVELIYELCDHVGIDKSLAETFLLGILGDTGNFAYLKPSQTKTLLIAKNLIGIGQIVIQDFQSRYMSIPDRVFGIVKEFINNMQNKEIEGHKPFSYSYVSREYLESYNITNPEIISAKNIFVQTYIRNITGHPWGFVVIPRDNNECSISLRSLPSGENVRIILEKMGIGGGHDLASGGTFKNEPDSIKAVEKVLKWLDENSL